jgi:hypothetical protein
MANNGQNEPDLATDCLSGQSGVTPGLVFLYGGSGNRFIGDRNFQIFEAG